MKKTIVSLLVCSPLLAADLNQLVVTGEAARSLQALHGLATKDGELAVKCGGDTCRIISKNRSLSYQDDADGTPFYVEQVGFRMDTAAALFNAMPKGTPVEPMSYV